MRSGAWVAALVAAGAALGCVRVGEERAARDLEVGESEAHGVRVVALGNAAAVRAHEPGRVALWAASPSPRVTLSAVESAEVEISFANLVPGSRLAIEGRGVGEPIEGTRAAASVEFEAGESVRIAVEPPAPDGPWSFLVYGDVQDAIDEVEEIYRVMNRERDARFALVVGDLTEVGSPEEFVEFEQKARALLIPFYATPGNHDIGTGETIYHDFFGPASHAFDYGGIRFMLIDSASAGVAHPVRERVQGWLDDPARPPLAVAGMHIAPFDPVGARSGEFSSSREASALLDMFSAAGVSSTYYGHVHSYYAFANAGIPAYITGGGGAIPERGDGVGRHFLRVDVDPENDLNPLRTALVRVDQ